MSSCQDSMDTEDSIPRPEYEDILPDEEDENDDEDDDNEEEEDDDEDDDDEFWADKSKLQLTSLESGSTQEALSTTQTNSSAETTSSISPTQSQPFEDANADEVVIGGSYDDEDGISYDEADENFEREEVEEDSRKRSEKVEENPQQQTEEVKDEPVNIVTITGDTPTSDIQTESTNNKLVMVTVLNENGKSLLPIQRAGQQMIAITKDKGASPLNENKATRIEVRSSTPSCRASREFIALQKSFTESKVLSEFVNDKDRQRKSRKVPLKSEDSTGDVSEREKIKLCRGRSKSCTRTHIRSVTVLNNSAPQKWLSDEKLNCKRENMRSQNTDFVQKQMKFLNRVKHDQTADDMSEMSESEQSLNESNKTICSLENKDDCWQPPPKKGADSFCWKCRKCGDIIACSKCPRSFHYRCIKIGTTTRLDRTWICPECINLENCINGTKKARKEALSIDMLNQLLLFALKRMKQIKGHEKLLNPPSESECPLYCQYVVNPVTLNSIQDKIEKKAFRCTEEFVLETKWIQHNVIIAYAAYGTKHGLLAKTLLKICRQEAAEIETCPECYLNANTHKDWFVDVCLKPHILLWAKLKGFPYWPAKGMGIGPNSLVNVRFFGDHDRAFVPVKDCYLYSEIDPNPNSGKRAFRPGIADCIKEVDIHIEKIKAKVGAFSFAPPKTPYDPNKELFQLEEMMPGVTEYVKRQQALQKPPLTYKIVKTADNNLSIIKKPDSGTESDHSMGAEKIKNNLNSTAENPKPSPLSEESKSKEDQTSSLPKNASSSKNILSKAMSLNYEVVAKPPNKDEANSSKINSVILKRKSDIVAAPPNVKKSKSSEDIPVKECLNSSTSTSTSTSTSPKHEEPVNATPPVLPPKRMRCNDSGEKPSSSPGPRFPLSFCVEPQTQQIQKAVVVQKPPKSQSQPVVKQSAAEIAANDPSSVAKLVQNRQGVTIKKLTKKQSSASTFFSAEENGPTSTMQQTFNKYVEQLSKPLTTSPLTKAIPLPGPPPKHVQNVAKPQQILAKSPPSSTLSASKSKAKTPPAQGSIAKMVQTSPPETEKACDQRKIVPRVEIKVEKPDEDQQSYSKPNPLPGNLLKGVAVGGTKSHTLQQSTSSKATSNNPPSIPVNPELIKKETVSDDDSQNSTPSADNLSSTVAGSQSISRSTEEIRLLDSPTHRIVVRSIESLKMQPPPLKNAPSSYTAPSSSSTPPSATHGQPKKSNARARKSFPNKGPSLSTVHLPLEVDHSLTETSMVYIPVDIENNIVPIQPLTAISKPISHAATLLKMSCTSSTPVSISFANTFCESVPVSTQTSTTPTPPSSVSSTATPPASTQPASSPATTTPPPPPNQPAVSDVISLNSVRPKATTTTSANSSTHRQSYVASLKTMSPLQLTEPTSSNANPSESMEMSDKNQEGDGHILSGIVTTSLASAITDTIVRGPPRLTPRPNGALRSDGSYGYNSKAGPFSRALVDNAHKMTDFFISVMQDTIGDMSNADILPAKIVELQLELEARTAAYEKRLCELKQNTDTMLCEMKKNMELERTRAIAETRKQCEIERIRAVEQTKKKQWCSNCGREANSYCCWNTAYCDTTCQGMDWLRHKPNCCQVNPHLNSELQGPGVLYPAPVVTSVATTAATQTNHAAVTTSSSGGGATIHIYSQPTPPPSVCVSTSAPIPISQISVTTSVAPKMGSNLPFPQPLLIPHPSVDASYKPKEILKLPPSTYLRAVPPIMRLPATPPVHRFNIPLPIAAASSAGGPPYTLIQREGNWELMSTPQQVVTTVVTTTTSSQQTPRLVSPVTQNLPQDNRSLGQVVVRPNQM